MDEKQIEKVKKLFALSESPNQAEAEAALRKAQELMLQYSITDAQLAETEYVERQMKHTRVQKKVKIPLESGLLNLLEAHFGVVTFYRKRSEGRVRQYPRWQFPNSTLTFYMYGQKDRVEAAEYVWEYLLRTAPQLLEQERVLAAECGVKLNSFAFYTALFEGLQQQLDRSFRAYREEVKAESGCELVPLGDDPVLEARKRGRVTHKTAAPSDAFSYNRGREAAEKVQLKAPVSTERIHQLQ